MNLALLSGFGWALRQRSSHPRWTWAIRALEARWANCFVVDSVYGKPWKRLGKPWETMGK